MPCILGILIVLLLLLLLYGGLPLILVRQELDELDRALQSSSLTKAAYCSSGTVLDQATLHKIMKGEAVMPSLLKAK